MKHTLVVSIYKRKSKQKKTNLNQKPTLFLQNSMSSSFEENGQVKNSTSVN